MANIRISNKDKKEYAKLVKNTKSKIRRTQKNYGIDLSDEVQLPSLESFKTRKEFNEWKNKQSSFTNRANKHYQYKKNQYGIVAPISLLNKIERDTKKAQKVVDKIIKEASKKPIISGGKVQGTVGQKLLTMKSPAPMGLTRPRDFDFDKISHPDRLNEVAENMSKRATGEYYDKRMEKMRDTYISELELSFNSDADFLIEQLRNMPVEDFYELYMTFDEFDFQVFYKMKYLDTEGHETILRSLETYVQRYQRGEMNPLFHLRNK